MDPLGSSEDISQPTWPERIFNALAMASILALCLIVTSTVISRWTIGGSIIPDDVLIVREFMVIVVLFPLALVTASRAHIAVTVFTNWLPERGRRVLSLLSHVLAVAFAGILLWAGWRLFARSWASGGYHDGDLYIPVWIGYGLFVLAFAAFGLRALAMTAIDLRKTIRT